jgi:hypothetical protein
MWNCIVFGATGSVGREVVHALAVSSSWSHVIVVGRSILPEHERYQSDSRFRFFVTDNVMDFGLLRSVYIRNLHINVIFNCIGAEAGFSTEEIRMLEVSWPLQLLSLAQDLRCELYSKVISRYAKPNSITELFRRQAEFVDEAQLQTLDNITIFKPGVLLSRRHNPRCGAGFFSALFCMKRIEVVDLAVQILKDAELTLNSKSKRGFQVYEHDQILKLL